jgi:hypothetical protein
MADGLARRIPDEESYFDERNTCWLNIGVSYLNQNDFDTAFSALRLLTDPMAQALFRVAAIRWCAEHFENAAARDLVRDTVETIEMWEPMMCRSDLSGLVKPICTVLGTEAVQKMSWRLKDPFTATTVLVTLSGGLQDAGVRRETLRVAEEFAKGVRSGDRDYALRWVIRGYESAELREDEQRARAEMSQDFELMNESEAQILGKANEVLQLRLGREPESDTPILKLKRFLDYQFNDLRVLFLTELADAGGIDDAEIEQLINTPAFQRIAPARPPNIYKDPSHYTVDFLAWSLFGRPVCQRNEDRAWIDGIGSLWVSDLSRFLATVQELFQNFGKLAAPFTPDQIDQGLWYLFGEPFWLGSQFDSEEISSEQIVEVTKSMYYPFRDYYMTRDKEFSGSAFFMWWDQFSSGRQNPVKDTAAIGVLQQILSLPNQACRDAALHGLNHLVPDIRIAAIIDGFLDEHRQSLSAEEIEWALLCRDGKAH